jgi:hypothetical protein
MTAITDTALVLFLASDAVAFSGTAASENKYALEIDGTPAHGMSLVFSVPSVVGTPYCSVTIYASSSTTIATTSGTYEIVSQRTEIGSAAGQYIVPFITKKRSVYFDFLMTSASGCIHAPEAWVSLDYNQDWSRIPEWRAG